MHQIRYFLAVSETLNLTKAAERCNVTQPSLSRAIKALETELGGELLLRERALSHLTELGQRMLPMLRQCYESALTAKMVAASIREGEAAPLSVAVSRTVALRPFTTVLRELSRASRACNCSCVAARAPRSLNTSNKARRSWQSPVRLMSPGLASMPSRFSKNHLTSSSIRLTGSRAETESSSGTLPLRPC